jgi:hypothetical protein
MGDVSSIGNGGAQVSAGGPPPFAGGEPDEAQSAAFIRGFQVGKLAKAGRASVAWAVIVVALLIVLVAGLVGFGVSIGSELAGRVL